MKALSGKPLPPFAWEVAVAGLLIAARAWAHGIPFLALDWVSMLCLFWIFVALGSRTRAWPYVTGGFMAGLLLLYVWRQLPLTLAVLGFGP